MKNINTGEHPQRSKEWYLTEQYVHLDFFDDTDEELESIGMTTEDVAKFRKWQKTFEVELKP